MEEMEEIEEIEEVDKKKCFIKKILDGWMEFWDKHLRDEEKYIIASETKPAIKLLNYTLRLVLFNLISDFAYLLITWKRDLDEITIPIHYITFGVKIVLPLGCAFLVNIFQNRFRTGWKNGWLDLITSIILMGAVAIIYVLTNID